MLTREQKATKGTMWLGRWQGWEGSAVSMAQYAREHGFDAQEAYRWKRILQRTGRWFAAESGVRAPAVPKKAPGGARFARVAVIDTPAALNTLVMRLLLSNGRRAEVEVFGMSQMAELVGVLERAS